MLWSRRPGPGQWWIFICPGPAGLYFPDRMNRETPGEIKSKAEEPAWFCVRCQRKREAVAASTLREFDGVLVFSPFLRYRRSTLRGPAWVAEPLFPCYLFARFRLRASLNRVRSARGVAGVVHFGDNYPVVPDEIIGELRRLFADREMIELPLEPRVGQSVELAGGFFHGLEAVIVRVLPARDRVKVLLDFMGRQTLVEVGLNSVVLRDARAIKLA
jgi:transcriptional antiterminator RfaH